WDGNVTGMEEEGRNHFYFQDDLGSPMRLADEAGRSEEIYGFDEFGNDIRTGQDIRTAHDIFKSPMQSFGFTGYQMDEAGGLYFAQARRYDAEAGRFTSEDFIKGHIAVPYTMNHYNYCWNRPMDLVDLNGMWPSLSDIGKGAQKLASSAADKVSKAADKVSDVAKDTAQGIKDTASNITHAAKNWANSDEGKIILTTAGYLGVGALAVATGGVAGVVLGGIAVGAAAGAVTGGVSNMMKGGTFANGYVGGAVNGAIVGGVTALPIPVLGEAAIPMANFIGGTVGNIVTTKLDEPDKRMDVVFFDSLVNGGIQAVTGKILGKVFGGITHGNINTVNKVVTGDLDGFIGNNILGEDIYAKIATGFVKYIETSLNTSSSTAKDLLYDNLIGTHITKKYEEGMHALKGDEK
ncbi:MAG: RHS repeat-associated core domain-containing protein, partial [Lachnospiraceae bacterium]|nr:RHS repeat-associated core domain-containing protein [Lachnospiraceae bacterium]